MKKNATIMDIAEAVGCSKTTVSRYLNGQTKMMSAETAARIEKMINLLDYKPSVLARSLKTKKTYTVGIILSDIMSPFATSVVVGAGKILKETNYIPFIVDCSENPESERNAVASLVSRGVDGLIVNTTSPTNDFLFEYVKEGIPIVLCDRRLRDYNMDIVNENNQEIIELLVSHLKEQGYNRIAFFTPTSAQSSAKDIRKARFLETIHEVFGYDASCDIYSFTDTEDPVKILEQKVQEFMATVKEGEVPAIIGANSVTTMVLFRAIKNLKINMPKEIGLCGTSAWNWKEGITWMDMMKPTITCAIIDGEQIGRHCAKRLIEKIEYPGGEPKTIRIPVTLQLGDSTDRTKNM